MNELPPKPETITLVRYYKKSSDVTLKKELWTEMENQMELTNMTLDTFVTKALEFFIQDLKLEQENEKTYLSFNEYQLFPSNPIPIRPHPTWYYKLEEDKDKK